jgi:hypothetical protein
MRWAVPFACLACLLSACGNPPPTLQSTSSSLGQLPTQPTMPAVPNTAPRVTVVLLGPIACLELPCTVTVQANASDPDGDALSYRWSGCATGAAAQAACVVSSPDPAVASVEVSDGNGHVVAASATAQGMNRAPYLQLSSFFGFSDTSPTLEALGNIIDPDEGVLCGGAAAYLDSISVSGDCRPTYAFSCSCLAGVELDIYRTAASGTCTVMVKTKNGQGRVGTSIFTVPYRQGTGAPGW